VTKASNARYKAQQRQIAEKFESNLTQDMQKSHGGLAFSKTILKRTLNPRGSKAVSLLERIINNGPEAVAGESGLLQSTPLGTGAQSFVQTPRMAEAGTMLMVFDDFSALLYEDVDPDGPDGLPARVHTTPLSVRPKFHHTSTGTCVIFEPSRLGHSSRELLVRIKDGPYYGNPRAAGDTTLSDFATQFDQEIEVLCARFNALPPYAFCDVRAEDSPEAALAAAMNRASSQFGKSLPFLVRDNIGDHDSHLAYISWKPWDPDIILLDEALRIIVEIVAHEYSAEARRVWIALDVTAPSIAQDQVELVVQAPRSIEARNGKTIQARMRELAGPLIGRFAHLHCLAPETSMRPTCRIAAAKPERAAPSAHFMMKAYARLEELTATLAHPA
jgi:hypothetical protein